MADIKSGKNIVWEETPYVVLYHEHSKTGRAGAVLRTRLKNLLTGNVLEKTFQGSEKVYEADITKSKAQYLYKESQGFAFMDMESYEQFTLSAESLGAAVNYLIEGTEVIVLNFNGNSDQHRTADQDEIESQLKLLPASKATLFPPAARW